MLTRESKKEEVRIKKQKLEPAVAKATASQVEGQVLPAFDADESP